MKSLKNRMEEYISWILFCKLQHKYTEEEWKPLGLDVKNKIIVIVVYGKTPEGIDNHHDIIKSDRLTLQEIIKEFNIS